MSDTPLPTMPPEVPASIRWHVFDRVITIETVMPTAEVAPQAMMPVLRQLVDEVVAMSIELLAASGKAVSCKAGCTACCHQLVSVSDVEARAIAELVDAMPEPERARVKARFAEAERRLALAWPLDDVIRRINGEERFQFAVDYFKLGLACPFLENDACSIYEHRPLICREHMVHSPPEQCWHFGDGDEEIEPVRIKRLSGGTFRMTSMQPTPVDRAVPLALLPYWMAQNTGQPDPRSGVMWFGEFMAATASIDQAESDEAESDEAHAAATSADAPPQDRPA